MSKKAPTSTHLFEWPELDQHLWQVATQKGNFLERDGRAAHWAAATRLQVQKGYGKWIFHLTAEGALRNRDQQETLSSALMKISFAHIWSVSKLKVLPHRL